jgi:hypothetical protein
MMKGLIEQMGTLLKLLTTVRNVVHAVRPTQTHTGDTGEYFLGVKTGALFPPLP